MQAIRPADPGKPADMLTQRKNKSRISLPLKEIHDFTTGVMTERISPSPVIRIITVRGEWKSDGISEVKLRLSVWDAFHAETSQVRQ
jgi:hypothetical protein